MKDETPVAVTSRSFSRHPVLRGELLARYQNVRFNDSGELLEGDALVGFLRGHAKAITALECLDASVFEAVPELRLVSKYGVGLDTIDCDAMARHGVRLVWTPGVNRRSVAELAIAFMIDLMHRVPEATQVTGEGQWRQVIGRQLSDRTVGIIGCGNVGKDVVILLQPFRCRVLTYDIRDYGGFYRQHGVTPVGLEDLLSASDVVTLHVPLDDSTRNMIDRAHLGLMRRDAVLVNTARGGLVDEAVLKTMLEEGRLAGAAFDVLGVEPPEDWGLVQLSNVIVTPHIGGSAEEAILAMGRAAIDGLSTV
jgi:D-3-phosphoglycerate dehydrogenase